MSRDLKEKETDHRDSEGQALLPEGAVKVESKA